MRFSGKQTRKNEIKIMLKIIRCLLYGLAILAGVAGLYDGGTPLVKYMVHQWSEPEYQGYYDTRDLDFPKLTFLLSLVLLIGVRICLALEKGICPVNPSDSVASEKKPVAPAPAGKISSPAVTAETPAPPVETADTKLTRLLNQKKD